MAQELGRDDLEPGRVVRHHGAAVHVTTASGSRDRPVLASVDPPPLVGDWVLVTDDAVWATLPRTALLRRREAHRDVEHPLVANVDAVLVTVGLDRPVRPGRLQRAVAMARDAGADALVVLTKADLVDRPDEAEVATAGVRAALPDVEVMVTAATAGTGLDRLRAAIAGRTVVLVGESGAGKSTLTNALVGEEVAAVGDVRARDRKGRHTTTTRQIHLLPGGGLLIDTPGIRSVGLWADAGAVAATFDDVELVAEECRFSNCTHTGEPGCAVAVAVTAGELVSERVEAWRELAAEAEASSASAERRARRADRRPGRGRRRP